MVTGSFYTVYTVVLYNIHVHYTMYENRNLPKMYRNFIYCQHRPFSMYTDSPHKNHELKKKTGVFTFLEYKYVFFSFAIQRLHFTIPTFELLCE